jgi:hypothetical protein
MAAYRMRRLHLLRVRLSAFAGSAVHTETVTSPASAAPLSCTRKSVDMVTRRATGNAPVILRKAVAGTYVGAMSGEGTEIAFHSDWSRPQFPQRKIRCSPAVRAAHGTVSTDLNPMS